MLQSNMRRILQGQSAGETASTTSQALAWTPAVEISETPDELVITAELPGIDADEVHVVIDGDMLTIRGEKKSERREGDDTEYYLVERSYGMFQRSFTLPSTVDPESIVAEFNNGVLTIHLRKLASERSRGREIPISASSSGNGGTQSLNAGASNRDASTSSQSRNASAGAQTRDASTQSQSRAASANAEQTARAGSSSGSGSGSSSGGSTSGRGNS
jgi:HSP20 family protein